MSHLLLITASSNSAKFIQALTYAQTHLADNYKESNQIEHKSLAVFFYSDAAYIANGFIWQIAGRESIQQQWQKLSNVHGFDLNVCISTALSRGITDVDNSKRHDIVLNSLPSELSEQSDKDSTDNENSVYADNLADGFKLVGLGVLAELMHDCHQVKVF